MHLCLCLPLFVVLGPFCAVFNFAHLEIEEFNADEEFQQSAAFSVLQIGELCNGLSEEYRRATGSRIQWNAIRGLRNIIVHAYGSIKLDILWDVVTTDIPDLQRLCDEQLITVAHREEP